MSRSLFALISSLASVLSGCPEEGGQDVPKNDVIDASTAPLLPATQVVGLKWLQLDDR